MEYSFFLRYLGASHVGKVIASCPPSSASKSSLVLLIELIVIEPIALLILLRQELLNLAQQLLNLSILVFYGLSLELNVFFEFLGLSY